MKNQRLQHLFQLMEANQFEYAAINPGFSLKYLTGLDFHLMERPVVFFISKNGKNALVLPHLEMSRAEKNEEITHFFPYGDNPATWQSAFDAAATFLKIGDSRMAIEPTQFRFLEFSFTHQSLPHAKIAPGQNIFDQLRLQKDENEIMSMQKAAQIAEAGLLATLPLVKIGMTEKEIASELVMQCLRAGAEGDFPFAPIVASGPNSADPHATPTDRKIQPGDILLFDWGVRYQGYSSDITRCFSIEYCEPEMEKISTIVQRANEAGRMAGRPGLSAGSVDQAARREIENAGFGEFFTHRTGHGLGMDAHESPYIFAENNQLLQKGMVYTIEPGIYIPGKGGIRIEDDVVVSENGCTSLTSLDRQLKVIG